MTTFSKTIAETILEQLGGNKFIAMTGSKNLCSDHQALTMQLAKNKSKAKHLRIEINNNDTYTMIFRAGLTKDYSFPIVAIYKGLYAEMLQPLFTKVTGFDTSL